MSKVFLYGEFQIVVPSFTKDLWGPVNEELKGVKGLMNKTWTYGIGGGPVGGLYEFDSLEHAQAFATGLYAQQAKRMGASLSVRLFDGEIVEEASRDMKSPYFS